MIMLPLTWEAHQEYLKKNIVKLDDIDVIEEEICDNSFLSDSASSFTGSELTCSKLEISEDESDQQRRE